MTILIYDATFSTFFAGHLNLHVSFLDSVHFDWKSHNVYLLLIVDDNDTCVIFIITDDVRWSGLVVFSDTIFAVW